MFIFKNGRLLIFIGCKFDENQATKMISVADVQENLTGSKIRKNPVTNERSRYTPYSSKERMYGHIA